MIDSKATLSYYGRSVGYIVFVTACVEGLRSLPDPKIQAISPVICYAILLVVLLVLKAYAPDHLERVKWFCRPGNVFLRTWISIMFFIFILPAPATFATVAPLQLLSWLFQCIIGNWLAVAINVGIMTASLSLLNALEQRNENAVSDADMKSLEAGGGAVDLEDQQKGNKAPRAPSLGAFRNADDPTGRMRPRRHAFSSSFRISLQGTRTKGSSLNLLEGLNNDSSESPASTATQAPTQPGPTIASAPGAPRSATSSAGSDEELGAIQQRTKTAPPLSAQLLRWTNSATMHQIAPLNIPNSDFHSSNGKSPTSIKYAPTHLDSPTHSRTFSIDEDIEYADSKAMEDAPVPELPASPVTTINKGNNAGVTVTKGTVVIKKRSEKLNNSTAVVNKPTATAVSRIKRSETVDSVASNVFVIEETAYIPTMDTLLKFWAGMTLLLSLLMVFCFKSAASVVLGMFNFTAIVTIFIFTTQHRADIVKHFPGPVRVLLQAVLIFVVFALVVVVFASVHLPEDWVLSIAEFRTGLRFTEMDKWGPGDYLTALVNTGVVSLAFQSLDALYNNWRKLVFLLPSIVLSCVIIVLQGAELAALMQSPDAIALPMWTRTMTTPVAVNVAALTGAVPSIVAASTIFNGLLALRTVVPIMDKLRVTNPIVRGTTASITGSLLGVLAVDENNETEAAGIAMASFGICTVVYTLLFTISSFVDLLNAL